MHQAKVLHFASLRTELTNMRTPRYFYIYSLVAETPFCFHLTEVWMYKAVLLLQFAPPFNNT